MMLQKIKKYFRKPKKMILIGSLTFWSFLVLCFLGMGIGGVYCFKNNQFLKQLNGLSHQYIFNREQQTVNHVKVNHNQWVSLYIHFNKMETQIEDHYYELFHSPQNYSIIWNKMLIKGDNFELEKSVKNLSETLNNKIDPLIKKNQLFKLTSDLNAKLNFNCLSNIYLMPIGMSLSILFLVLLVSFVYIWFFKKALHEKIIPIEITEQLKK